MAQALASITENLLRVCALAIACSASLPGQVGSPSARAPAAQSLDYDRPVSWKLLVPNFLNDQKNIWIFPRKLAKGRDWIPTVAVGGTTAALLAADPYEAHYFRTTTSFHDFNNVFSSNATNIGTIVAPASFYVAGLLSKDDKMQHTALLAGEAAADVEVVATLLKAITRRDRPSSFPQNGNYRDSFFQSKGSVVGGSASFPSGHTIAAFSIATVFAHRYRNHRWAPYAAYGAAAAVGFSRLSLSAHFTSDVFAGAALGYTISRFAVLRY